MILLHIGTGPHLHPEAVAVFLFAASAAVTAFLWERRKEARARRGPG
jgi:hypothetical protein